MKKLVLLFSVAIMCTLNMYAQNSPTLGVGPFLGVKACVNAADIPNGTKTGVSFNGMPDIGVTMYVPFSKQSSTASTYDLGYSTYSVKSKPESGANDDNTSIAYYNYITIAPSVNFSGFMVGASFGIPVGASISNLSGTFNSTASSTQGMSIITELRIGGMIPIMTNELGRLNFIVIGGYMVNGVDSGTSSSYNPKVASLMMGLNFLLNFQRAE